jgi:hypothetical protein
MDGDNDKALGLLVLGRFSEAADLFVEPEFRCLAILNSGDRSKLLAEPESYEKSLCLAIARGSKWLVQKIARTGLSGRSGFLDFWFKTTISKEKPFWSKRLVEHYLGPICVFKSGEPTLVGDQQLINNLLNQRKYAAATECIRECRAQWNDHPKLLVDEVRAARVSDRPKAYPLAKQFCISHPTYFPFLQLVMEEAIERLKVQKLEEEEYGWLAQAGRRGIMIDPFDSRVRLGYSLFTALEGRKPIRALIGGGLVLLRQFGGHVHDIGLLRGLKNQYKNLPPPSNLKVESFSNDPKA